MIANQKKIENKCCFYVSDFHLEMTILPYINEKIKENKDIVIVTQNKLEESIKILISRMNLKNKEQIIELDWNNSEIDKIKGRKNIVIINNGTKKFIEDTKQKMEEIVDNEIAEIINCYSFNEIKDEIVEIREKHTEVLNIIQKNYWKIKINSIWLEEQ